MEKADTTRDFMNVDSFSQLPFIRPAPAKEKPPVRLFGIEVQNSATPTNNDGTAVVDQNTNSNTNTNNTTIEVDVLTTATTSTDAQSNTANSGGGGGGGNGRKFECHYCCRNFPTSQALGGHQNAHKRERQHAKRAYLQSAAMLHPTGPSELHHHLYGGLLGYHHNRLGSTHMPSSSSWSHSSSNYHNTLSRYYPTSNNYHSYPSSHNQHHHHHHQPLPTPINGSPLAMWRIPAAQSHSGSVNRDGSLLQQQYRPPSHPTPPSLPVLGGSEAGLMIGDSSKASQSSQRYVLEGKKGAFQDHVSLDLHL